MNTIDAINEDRLIQAARAMQADQDLAQADDDEITDHCLSILSLTESKAERDEWMQHLGKQAIISGPIEGGMSPMTLQQAREYLRGFGIWINKRHGEYRVNVLGGQETEAYYTDNLADAIETGRTMSASVQGG